LHEGGFNATRLLTDGDPAYVKEFEKLTFDNI
jgi:hypothetical protein